MSTGSFACIRQIWKDLRMLMLSATVCGFWLFFFFKPNKLKYISSVLTDELGNQEINYVTSFKSRQTFDTI